MTPFSATVPADRPRHGARLGMPRREGGFAAVAIAVCMAACVLLCLMAEATMARAAMARRTEQARAAYVVDAAKRLEAWYRDHTEALDLPGAQVPIESDMERAAGIVPRWGVRVSVSPASASGTARYRTIAVWLPAGPPVDSVWRDGSFASEVSTDHALVDGRAVHAVLRDRTLDTMRRFAASLEARARALVLRDSDRLADVNHFRPVDPGCIAAPAELPCIDRYVAAEGIDWTAYTGTDATELRTAWGSPIEVSNKTDASAERPPFTFALRAVAPWGETMRMVAVQPIE